MKVRRTYHGIPARLAAEYLEGLGGVRRSGTPAASVPGIAHRHSTAVLIAGPDWSATITDGPALSHGSIELNRIDVSFSGDDEVVARLLADFAVRMNRGGG